VWSAQFLESIPNTVTKSRYTTSVHALLGHFRAVRLSQVATDRIEEFKQARLENGVGPATVNRDLAVSRRMLRLAKRQRLITHSPFDEVEFLEERQHRRQPHILTFEEEQRLLAVASPMVRMLVVLLVETGLRVAKEAYPLKWEDVDLLNGTIHIRESKTLAGRRMVPLSEYCKTELAGWRSIIGPEFSCYVFPNPKRPAAHVGSVKKSWATTLKAARVAFFPVYNLRATFPSRLSAAGESDLFVAQMMGHSSAGILQTYAKVIDQCRRDAIRKLEALRSASITDREQTRGRQPEVTHDRMQ
jgi:integrase